MDPLLSTSLLNIIIRVPLINRCLVHRLVANKATRLLFTQHLIIDIIEEALDQVMFEGLGLAQGLMIPLSEWTQLELMAQARNLEETHPLIMNPSCSASVYTLTLNMLCLDLDQYVEFNSISRAGFKFSPDKLLPRCEIVKMRPKLLAEKHKE